MGRPRGSKNKKEPKKFCIHGHNISICGRDKTGFCNECKKDLGRVNAGIDSRFKRICINGHDTFIVGRDSKGWCHNCKEIYSPKYRKLHKKKTKIYNKKYRLENKENINKKSVEKRKQNMKIKIAVYLRARLRKALNGEVKEGSSVSDLDCTIDFFKDYVASKFYDNMTWNNWGKVWELDHIKELSDFDLTNLQQLKEVAHYTNYQPLTIKDHKEKTLRERRKRLGLE